MLYTDRDFITSDDLLILDAEAVEVADAHGISVDGTIHHAIEECAHDLLSRQQSFTGYLSGLGIGAGHLAAVFQGISSSVSRPYIRLSNIVVSSGYPQLSSPIQHWTEFYALYMLYRAAYMRKQNDRYESKMLLYKDEAKTAWATIQDQGLSVVLQPFPCPGATNETNAGTWDHSNVSVVTATASGGVFDAAVSWTGASYVSQAERGNAESALSSSVRVIVTTNKAIKVDITSCIAPTGTMPQVGTAEGQIVYLQATGWNVWIGETNGHLYLQNPTPIAIATKTYELSADPVLTGSQDHAGQFADYQFAFGAPRLYRA